MYERQLPKGINFERHKDGSLRLRANVQYRGVRKFSDYYDPDTDLSVLVTWQDTTRKGLKLAHGQAQTAPAPATAAPPRHAFTVRIAEYARLRAGLTGIGNHVTALRRWASAFGRDRDINTITRDEVRMQAAAWLKDRPLNPRTARPVDASAVRRWLYVLQSFFKELHGADGYNPVVGIKKPPAKKYDEPRAVDYFDIERLIAEVRCKPGATAPLGQLRLWVLAYTGIPPGVLVNVRPGRVDGRYGWVDFRRGWLHLPDRLKGDGVAARTIPLTAEGLAAFVALHEAGGLVTFSGDALAKTYRSAARRAGGALVDVNGAPITHLYDLRHSFGTAMYRKTGDLATVGRFLGHAKNSPLTARYAMGAERDVDLDAAAAMSDVFRPAQRKARREQRRLAAVPRRRTAA